MAQTVHWGKKGKFPYSVPAYKFMLQVCTQLSPINWGQGSCIFANGVSSRGVPSSTEPSMQVPTLPVCPARQVQIVLARQVLQVGAGSWAEGVTPAEMWVLQQEGERNKVEGWHLLLLWAYPYTSRGQGITREWGLATKGLNNVNLLIKQMLDLWL